MPIEAKSSFRFLVAVVGFALSACSPTGVDGQGGDDFRNCSSDEDCLAELEYAADSYANPDNVTCRRGVSSRTYDCRECVEDEECAEGFRCFMEQNCLPRAGSAAGDAGRDLGGDGGS